MGNRARTTIRCAQDDLVDDWADATQRRAILAGSFRHVDMSALAHPLPEHVRALWDPVASSDDVAREDIASISEPKLWKARTGRWRGAIFEDPDDDQVWLVAAGLRREGDHDDFYEEFARRSSAQVRSCLPSRDDRLLLERDRQHERVRKWQIAIVSVAVDVVAGPPWRAKLQQHFQA